jgi:hypothetical protein
VKIVATCNNKNRSTMKCQRVCCRRSKPESKDESVQTNLALPTTRPSWRLKNWDYLLSLPSSKK